MTEAKCEFDLANSTRHMHIEKKMLKISWVEFTEEILKTVFKV